MGTSAASCKTYCRIVRQSTQLITVAEGVKLHLRRSREPLGRRGQSSQDTTGATVLLPRPTFMGSCQWVTSNSGFARNAECPQGKAFLMPAACLTNYEHLYARGYYAHEAGATSFDIEQLPPIVARLSALFGNRLLDIGGGNGMLAAELQKLGVRGATIDAADREAPGYFRFDMASHDPGAAAELRRRLTNDLGEIYLATCFDVAEHIDIEHVPDFILNLAALISGDCLISISTRPSSAANRFHPTVIPIATWKKLFELAGFSVQNAEECQQLRSNHRFRSDDFNLIAVSHWQMVNPFHESHCSHQHYFYLSKKLYAGLDHVQFKGFAASILDTSYRFLKRELVNCDTLPPLSYHVNFIQDWSFLRSLMDVWPSDRLLITIRSDLLAAPYRSMLRGYLERTANTFLFISSAAEGAAALDSWGLSKGSLAVTATEGPRSVSHLMGSLLMLEAGKRGAQTLCLQHGMSISRSFLTASANVGVWDASTEATLSNSNSQNFHIARTGSPKFLDALLPAAQFSLKHRLGRSNYERAILIALNLHWKVHRFDTRDTYDWIQRICFNNPDTLFVLRPHPDDATSFENPQIFGIPNVLFVDEITLLSIDWSVSRLLRAVDGVITTYSTIAIDAAAAGKPVVFLPSEDLGFVDKG